MTTTMRLREMDLTDLDRIMADQPVPAAAWRTAGMDPDPTVATLADCTLAQLESFAVMDVATVRGMQFRAAASGLAVAMAGQVESETAVLARIWDRFVRADAAVVAANVAESVPTMAVSGPPKRVTV